MNHYKRSFPRLALALLFGLSLMGCATPAQARAINLDQSPPQITKLGATDTLLATHGNMYHIDSNIAPSSTFLTTDASVAVAYVNPRTMDLLIDARKPGMTDLYYVSGGKPMRLQIVVR